MGFDLYGVKAKTETGEYFRNNVWYWRPLWIYVCEACKDVITIDDANAGTYNDSHLIDSEKATAISLILQSEIDSGRTEQYKKDYDEWMKSIPDEKCDLCNGTGKRTDMEVANGCNKCQGKGVVRPFDTNYPFDVENVKDFAKFCEYSGGFEIS